MDSYHFTNIYSLSCPIKTMLILPSFWTPGQLPVKKKKTAINYKNFANVLLIPLEMET